MRIKNYIDEEKKLDGYASCCAYIECESNDLSINIHERSFTFEEADRKVIERLKGLLKDVNDIIELTK